jgi:type II secretion system protein N
VVRKLRLVVLIAFWTVIALGAILLIGVNLYVQSQATQAKIQQELSQRLGAALEIRRMSVTPWGGLELSGITIAQNSAASRDHFLEARTFRLRVRFLSLFSRRLVIKEVSLVNPNVIWPQDTTGKWRLPGSREKETPIVSGEQAPANSEARTAIMPPNLAASPPSGFTPVPLLSPRAGAIAKFPTSQAGLAPEVQRVNIKGGNFSFLDRAGNVIGTFAGLDFRSSMRNGLALRGNAKVAKISVRDRFFLEQLQSPVRYEPNVLELSNMSAHAGNGEISGQFAMQPETEDSPFSASVTFRNVQADQIVTDAGGPKGMVQGKLEGEFEASGKTADPDALIGKGEIFLRDGRVRQYSLLVAIGQILQIEELTELRLEQAQAKYHVSPGLVTVDELILRSPNVRLSASGTITFDGKLKLDSQLAINEKLRGQLFRAIADNFQPISDPGYFALNFQVGGSVDRPRTNLMDKLVGNDLKDLGNAINSLFGGGKRERPKKKKRGDEVTPVAPAPSVAPEVTSPQTSATPSPSP